MSHHNHGQSTIHVLRDTIVQGRALRFQPLNNYRERFNLERYTSFEDLTGESTVYIFFSAKDHNPLKNLHSLWMTISRI